MRLLHILAFIFIVCLCSCIVQAPKYAKIEQVLQLKPGMSKDEVHAALGIPPYDISLADGKGETLIYKYRVTDRKTLPFLMKPNNGVKATGKWVDLFVTYSEEGRVTKIESCSECETTKPTETKFDPNVILTLVTVTIPAVLVYLGLNRD